MRWKIVLLVAIYCIPFLYLEKAAAYELDFTDPAELRPRTILINPPEAQGSPITITCDPYGHITIQWAAVRECRILETRMFYCGNFPNLEQALKVPGPHHISFIAGDADQRWQMLYSNDHGVSISWKSIDCAK